MVCARQLQEAQEDARGHLREQLQQLSGRARALCQALRGAVDLLLDCIRATQRAAGSLSGMSQGAAAGGGEQLLLCPANAEAIAAMVDLSVSEASLPDTHRSSKSHDAAPGCLMVLQGGHTLQSILNAGMQACTL